MPKFNKQFSEVYKNQVFSVWYNHNRPKLGTLIDFLDPDEEGDIPAPETIKTWREQESWDDRAENLNIEVQQRTDRELINIRMDMMRRHAEMAKETQEMAFEYLKESGFDSSASAVAGLFKAFDEEKKSRGMEVALTQVFSMNDEDLQKTMNKLLSRVSGLDPDNTVDGEIDAVSNTETTDE